MPRRSGRHAPAATRLPGITRYCCGLRDEQGQMVPPMDFIPAAERFGLMPQIDRWVIDHAFAEQCRRTGPGRAPARCMINLSGASLDNPELADFICDRLEYYSLPAGCIGFELTETAAISRLGTALNVMNRLKEFGCPIALDDFGSGMSSYGYLRELPVDILKIDGSFVRDMATIRWPMRWSRPCTRSGAPWGFSPSRSGSKTTPPYRL